MLLADFHSFYKNWLFGVGRYFRSDGFKWCLPSSSSWRYHFNYDVALHAQLKKKLSYVFKFSSKFWIKCFLKSYINTILNQSKYFFYVNRDVVLPPSLSIYEELSQLLLQLTYPSYLPSIPNFELIHLILGGLDFFLESVGKKTYSLINITYQEYFLEALLKVDEEISVHEQKFLILFYLSIRINVNGMLGYPSEGLVNIIFEEFNHIIDTPLYIKHQLQSSYKALDWLVNVLAKRSYTILFELDNEAELVFDLYLTKHLLEQGHTLYLCPKVKPFSTKVSKESIELLIKRNLFYSLKDFVQKRQLIILQGHNHLYKSVPNVSNSYKQAFLTSDILFVKGVYNMDATLLFKNNNPIPYNKATIFFFALPFCMNGHHKIPFQLRCFWIKNLITF